MAANPKFLIESLDGKFYIEKLLSTKFRYWASRVWEFHSEDDFSLVKAQPGSKKITKQEFLMYLLIAEPENE